MKFAYEISDDDKREFVELLRQGMKPNRAATELDSTGTQFRRLYSGKSQEHFDPAFAAAVEEALLSDEHTRNLIAQLRDLQWDKAAAGDSRMIEKLSYIHDPLWETLRHQNLNVNVGIEVLQRAIPGLGLEELEQIRAALAQNERPQLEAVPEPVEAEAVEV